MNTVLILHGQHRFRMLLTAALTAREIRVIERPPEAAAEPVADSSIDVALLDPFATSMMAGRVIDVLRERNPSIRFILASQLWTAVRGVRGQARAVEIVAASEDPEAIDSLSEAIVRAVGQGPESSKESASGEVSEFLRERDQLRSDFILALPAKFAELELKLKAAPDDPSHYAAAEVIVHRLRGSAGAFGFADLGEAAGHLEDILLQRQNSGEDSGNFRSRVESRLQAARMAMAVSADGSEPPVAVVEPKMEAVLVVDDDIDFLQWAGNVARRVSIEVVMARSAEAAVEHAQARRLQALILDVHLGTEKSFLLARQVRETPHNAEIPIAFVSVDQRVETRIAAITAGASRFLEKPLTAETFASVLQDFGLRRSAEAGRVLIVDDDADVAAQYSSLLRAAGIATETLYEADGLMAVLEDMHPDLVVLDIHLPRISGLDICRALRMSTRWSLLPVLIVSARTDNRTRLEAFRSGASDVIAKPILPDELLARVEIQLERTRLVRERSEKDPLSGLLMRRTFLEAFNRTFSRCTRNGEPMALVLIDIDNFKQLNDRYGHLAGDHVISSLGELLRRRFRAEDLRGRWGGEEFILGLACADEHFGRRAAAHLLEEFGRLQFPSSNGEMFRATFTAGVAASSGIGDSFTSLLRRADEALYRGKRQGRRQVC